MREVRLWALDTSNPQSPKADAVDGLKSTETEALLEQTLVASPALLEPGLQLVGRQVPSENGPLDLLGVDRNGRLVIFELKRGTLAREAVAQILDYASDLDEMDRDDLARHLEQRSGEQGVPKIDDFNAWYNEMYPENNDEFSLPPRLVLVGLGVDNRTRRMVRFLAQAGVEIDVLTFHGFVRDGQTFLAREVEVASDQIKKPSTTRGQWTVAALEETLRDNASEANVAELLNEMREFVADHLKTTHRGSPIKSGVTFYKRAWAEDSTGPARAYVQLTIHTKRKGCLVLVLTYRARRDGGRPVEEFLQKQGAQKTEHWLQHYEQHEITIDARTWPEMREDLGRALNAVAEGVEAAAAESEGEGL